MEKQSASFKRFGDFEADLRSGELRKAGLKLKLTGQPFQVLAILLERPGAVVTREELQKRLWPDTFVDVDHNLNTAINKIREVLGDSAEGPRFVETLPRRGYRFIAPVDGRFRLDDSRSVLEKLLLLGSSFKRSLMALMVTAAALAPVGIFYIHRAPKLAGNHIGRLTVLTDRPSGVRDLVAYLSGYGAESSTLNTSELGRIAATVPDIIIIAADTRDSWRKQTQSALRQVFANHKVFAMGYGGAQLLSELGLQIGNVAVTQSRLAVVENPTLLKALSLSSSDRVLQVSQAEGEIVGAYDEGSPDMAGFEGIARWQNTEHHWSIARQGNYVLWGFDSPAEQMTDAGKRLLVNLLIEQRMHPSVPLSQARTKLEHVQPGLLAGQLNAQFPTSPRHFQVRKPGRITARLSWNPAELPLALILNGPGHTGYFARKDGISPLEIAFDVTDGHVFTGIDWRINVCAFGEIGGTLIDYKLKLSFPTSMAGPQ